MQQARPARFLPMLLLGTLVLAAPLVAQDGDLPITTTDLLEIQQVGSPAISPDGSLVAYTVQRIVSENEDEGSDYRYLTHIYLAPTDGSSPPRQLTRAHEGAGQPTWHPEGDRLAFVRPVDGRPQIFILPMDGGEAQQLTRMETGASSPQWSPDGTRLLFASSFTHRQLRSDTALGPEPAPAWDVERPLFPDTRIHELDEVEADPDGTFQEVQAWLLQNQLDDNPRILHRLDFLGETDLSPEPSYTHLFVVEAEPDAEPTPLTSGFHSSSPGVWLGDGQRVVMAGNLEDPVHPDRLQESHLYVVDAEGGEPRLLLDLEDHSLFAPTPSPDGARILFLASDITDRGYAQTQLGMVPVETDGSVGDATFLLEGLDRAMGAPVWSADGRFAYTTMATEGGVPIVRFDVETGEHVEFVDRTRGVQALDAGPGGIAYVLTEVANPFELYAASLDGSDARQLTRHNADWLADRRVSIPEEGTLTRPDGTEVQYWVMRPTFFEEGERYPLLTNIHGGPSVMWGPGEASMWHEFQLMASRGYGVVFSNPRGSAGYGRDFQHGNHQDWGHGPAGDVLAATSAATELDWVDPDRLVVTGGSYAGYLTAWIVAHDHRFQAAVAQRGVYDLITFLGEGNAWRLIPDRFELYPWDEGGRDLLVSESPFTYVDQIQTPLMVIHGDVDLRTGVSQSEMLVRALKILDRPVEYVRYPGGAHDLSRTGDPHQRMDRLLRIYEFLERHLQN